MFFILTRDRSSGYHQRYTEQQTEGHFGVWEVPGTCMEKGGVYRSVREKDAVREKYSAREKYLRERERRKKKYSTREKDRNPSGLLNEENQRSEQKLSPL